MHENTTSDGPLFILLFTPLVLVGAALMAQESILWAGGFVALYIIGVAYNLQQDRKEGKL